MPDLRPVQKGERQGRLLALGFLERKGVGGFFAGGSTWDAQARRTAHSPGVKGDSLWVTPGL